MKSYAAYILNNPNFSGDPMVSFERMNPAWKDFNRVTLEAENLEQVFAMLNHGSGCELEGYRGRSLSVGDVVVDNETGEVWLCAPTGWQLLNTPDKDS